MLDPTSGAFDFNSIQTNLKFEAIVSCTDSEGGQWNHMKSFDVHTRDSIVCGLIAEYQGASKYLEDRFNPANSTQTLNCRVNSKKERLNLDILSQKAAPILDSGDATHVVVGINHGAETYCVLVRNLEEGSDADRNARGRAVKELSELASRMMTALKARQDWADFEEQFQGMMDQISCRLYSDFPTQFVGECSVYQAYRHCLQLIMEMESNQTIYMLEDCQDVPLTVYLCPLELLGPQPVIPLTPEYKSFRPNISDYVEECLVVWISLKAISAQANALRVESNAKIYTFSRLSLRQFEKLVEEYQELFRKSLKSAVVKSRKSNDTSKWYQAEKEAKSVIEIIQSHDLFSTDKLEVQWLSFKNEELRIAKRMASVEEVAFMPSLNQVVEEISKSKKYALVLIVPPVDGWTNGYVYAMKRYLKDHKTLTMTYEDYDYYDDELPWYIKTKEKKRVIEQIDDLFIRVLRNKNNAKQVQLYITFGNSGDPLCCRYSVYEAGNLLKDNLNSFPGFPPWRF